MLVPSKKKDATIYRFAHLLIVIRISQEQLIKTKNMQIKKLLQFSLFMIFVIILGCQKDHNASDLDNFLGTWVSTDKSDTLFFIDVANLYNSNTNMHYDHYDYKIFDDSIKIGYSGKLLIYVLPTMHSYHLDGNKLSIDFSNKSCYGFDSQVINYTKKGN